LSGDAKESAETSYYDLIKDRLAENWALPPWLARQKLSAQVIININAQGHVARIQFTRTSGNPQFDDAIRTAIKQSDPFPSPPQEILTILQNQGILVGFPL
jgi:TonB family protein